MDTEITIIGAGVIGLAIAEELSDEYEVFVIERNNTFGQETSSRNSEVIHAGIYYPPGSLKSVLCVEGNRILYEYCKKYEVPFRKCGKLIVATASEEIQVLERIRDQAEENGVLLEFIDKPGISSLEPEIFALKALYSHSTGIIDSHGLMKRLETNTINNGGHFVYKSRVTAIRKITNGYEVVIEDPGGNSFSFTTRVLINSAGLDADKISGMAGIDDPDLKISFCKGEYFRINPPANRLVNRLIYPVPHPNMEGIGVHLTIDMAGGARLGPDVEYLGSNTRDYRLTPEKSANFLRSAQKFLPFLKSGDISPDMAGIRPKIQRAGEPQKDFYIKEESERGLPGFINLVGMESPGLTSSLSIGKYVRRLVTKYLKFT